ncbi:MAG: hypothetical protein ACRYGI_17770 [Janthinobacterium lividum]
MVVEVFEWHAGALMTAHERLEILALWERYALVFDDVPLNGQRKRRRSSSRSIPDSGTMAS